MIPDELVVLYVAFLKNHNRVSWAIEQYYSEINSMRRARLIQELSKELKGAWSVRLARAEKAISILDKYNRIFIIEEEIDPENIDFDEAEILTVLGKAGVPIQ